MPKMVTLVKNPDYKADTPEQKETFKNLKPVTVAYQTALQNMRNSGGMYKIEAEKQASTVKPVSLEDMPADDLKVMMISLGIKTEKQMTRTAIIGLIRKKMAEVEIVDE